MPEQPTAAVLAAVAIGLALVSCTSSQALPTDPAVIIETTGSTIDPATIELDPDDVVWQAHTGGGDIPATSLAAEVPSLTIYGDGRMYLTVPGSDRRFDQPVPFLIDRVSPADLTRFLAVAESTGLFEPDVDFGTPTEHDLPTTSALLRRNDEVLALDVYALGARFDVDLTAEQVANREALRRVLSAAEQLAADPQPWPPDHIRVLRMADDAPFVDSPEADPDQPPPPWPGPDLEELLTETGGGPVLACGELTGRSARRVFDAALENPTPRWTVGDAERTIVLSAVLPGESACEGR